MKQLPVASDQLPVKTATQFENYAAFWWSFLANRIVAGRWLSKALVQGVRFSR
jgi:hypothetical protein